MQNSLLSKIFFVLLGLSMIFAWNLSILIVSLFLVEIPRKRNNNGFCCSVSVQKNFCVKYSFVIIESLYHNLSGRPKWSSIFVSNNIFLLLIHCQNNGGAGNFVIGTENKFEQKVYKICVSTLRA